MRKTALLNLVFLLVTAAAATAETRRVPSDEYSTIQDAIDHCNNGDVVIVDPNTYTGPGNSDIDFGGLAITVRSIDPNDPNIVAATIVDCNGSESHPHRGFRFQSGEDANSILDGFTIINGYATEGGAVLCEFSSPTISHCIITSNSAEYHGGAIGGALSGPNIIDCYINGNSARRGGGIDCYHEGNLLITNCTVTGNSAEQDGGGIHCFDSSPVIKNCTITGNTAEDEGGGIHSRGSSPTITNCTITGNTAGECGGGICCDSYGDSESSLTVTNCTISGNSAKLDNGGGIYCESGWDSESSLTITNCTISGNSAIGGRWSEGGGIALWMDGFKQTAIITNCTIVGNRAGWAGGGLRGFLHFWGPPGFESPIKNCIIWNNIASQGDQLYHCDIPAYSCIQDWTWGDEGNIDDDPCFVSLGYWADANDPNIPAEPNDPNAVWVDGDYHLLPPSPCIDAGDNNSVPEDTHDLDGDGNTTEPIPWDLDGNPRFIDGDSNDTDIVDMGAYEVLPGPMDLLTELSNCINGADIPKGIANNFQVKLDTALQKLEDDNENNDVAAINSLQAFINAVEAQRGKKISEEDANDLIETAQQIIDMLSGA